MKCYNGCLTLHGCLLGIVFFFKWHILDVSNDVFGIDKWNICLWKFSVSNMILKNVCLFFR
jgi:hypothetical protein